jgi:hypothetical protein
MAQPSPKDPNTGIGQLVDIATLLPEPRPDGETPQNSEPHPPVSRVPTWYKVLGSDSGRSRSEEMR